MAKPKTLIPQHSSTPVPVLESEYSLKMMNRKFASGSFVNELGLNVLKAGDKVPESNGVPRIFLFREGKVSSLAEGKMELGSREFWQAAVMGQVFAYPAGEKHPVQLQVRNLDKIEPDMTFSDPLDPQKLPQTELPHRPENPGGITGYSASAATGGSAGNTTDTWRKKRGSRSWPRPARRRCRRPMGTSASPPP